MLHELINHSPDLKRLRDEGYEIEVKNSYLLVHSIPYVNTNREVLSGVLVTSLELAGDRTTKPQDHVIHFIGEHPCNNEGNIITGIQHSTGKRVLADGIEIDHSFSNKPAGGFTDYYEKVTSYCRILSSYAEVINPAVSAKTHKVIELNESDSPFHYLDTNSSRADIEAISAKLSKLKIAIVGLGGTGSYVLDLIAKTPVREIHLFDHDDFLSHNAFRSPGAASIGDLRKKPKKVQYLHAIYAKMHKYIIPHELKMNSSVLEELSGMDFVFICIDEGEVKKEIIAKLVQDEIPFIDVGMGVNAIDGKLSGSLRVTTVTKSKNDHIQKRISMSDKQEDDYDKNIQIAELNALNAALAVIKWKKIFGFYHDFEGEHHAEYVINVGTLVKDENIS